MEVETSTGDLLLRVGGETIRQQAPLTYQETAGGGRREVESRYELRADGRVGFEVGEYDRSAPLVIDPTLVYSTFFGGSGDETAWSLAVDSAGNAYITGTTYSTDFPATAGAFDTTNNGSDRRDLFVMKLNSTGTGLIYATYLGGNSLDVGYGLAVDAAGNAYVTGDSASSDFPVTSGALDTTYNGGEHDAFVTRLNSTGTALVHSTFLGGGATERTFYIETANAIALDAAGDIYVAGVTLSSDFPTTSGAFDTTISGTSADGFVSKIHDTTVPAPAPTPALCSTVEFGASSYSVQEDCTSVTVTVNRTGDASGPASVNYRSSDGTATERRDYITALGKLQFAPARPRRLSKCWSTKILIRKAMKSSSCI